MSAVLAVIATLLLLIAAISCSGSDDGDTTPAVSGGTSPSVSAPSLPPHATLYGAEAGDQAGTVVTGDFNGDGARDVVMAASTADGPQNVRPDAGEAYVLLGPLPQSGERDTADGADAIIYGAAAGDTLGRSAVAGDFNGDGIDDLALGAPSAAGAGGSGQAGAVFVIFGSPALGGELKQIDLAAQGADAVIRGADTEDYFAYSLAAGDLDADGRTDLLAGALFADGPDNSRDGGGEVYAFLARDLGGEIDLATSLPYALVYGSDADDRLGEAIAAGDVNGDGADDMVLVSTFADGPSEDRDAVGETNVIYSPRADVIDLRETPANRLVIGIDEGDQLGHSVAACDVDGDGREDLWLGAVSADGPENAQDLAGEAVLVASDAGAPAIINVAEDEVEALVYGPVEEARLGRGAACADLDANGRGDLIISAPNVPERRGTVYVIFGGEQYPENARESGVTLVGMDAGDIMGHESFGPPFAVADFDGDGASDLLISAAQGDGPDNARPDAGEAYIIYSAGSLAR